jgi:hypothetical protein
MDESTTSTGDSTSFDTTTSTTTTTDGTSTGDSTTDEWDTFLPPYAGAMPDDGVSPE